MPQITIITVCYNASSTIEETIKSVAKQKPNCQYIIVDGGSTDSTVEIISNYTSVVDILVSEPDKGIYDAMNKGWELAEMDNYILYLGSGDKLITLPDLKQYLNYDVIYGDVLIGTIRFTSKCDFRLKLGNTLHHQALLVKKTAELITPFSLKYPLYADFDFNQRLLKSNKKFIKASLFISYALEGGVSAQRNNKEMLSIVKKNYSVFYQQLAKIYYQIQHARNVFL
jgi:glycosyltransferase involved in cell wall biosynthesis